MYTILTDWYPFNFLRGYKSSPLHRRTPDNRGVSGTGSESKSEYGNGCWGMRSGEHGRERLIG